MRLFRETPGWLRSAARPVLALVVLGYVVALMATHVLGPGPESLRRNVPKGVDYPTFYAGGRMVWEGRRAALYNTEAYRRVVRQALERKRTKLDPFYPPPIFVAMAPLGALPYRISVLVYSALAIAGLAAGGRLLRRLAPAATAQDPRLGWLGYFGLWPVAASVLVGHPSPVLGLIAPAAALALRGGAEFQAGALLGLVAYKPPLVLAVGAALGASLRPRLVTGFLLGGGVLCLVATPFVGWDGWTAWFGQVARYDDSLDRLMRYPARMFNLRAALSLPFPKELWPVVRWPALAVSAGTLVLGGRILAGAIPSRPAAAALRFGAFIVAVVLGAPHLYEYDAIILAVPAALVAEAAFRPGFELEKPTLLLGLGALLVVFPIHLLTARFHVPLIQPALGVLLWTCWKLARRIESEADCPAEDG